jgi:hypothetical protein
MRRPWHARIGKSTAAACVVGVVLVTLGLVASTTDAAAAVAARIQLAFEGDVIPPAAADATPAERPAVTQAFAAPATPADDIDLELPATPAESPAVASPAPRHVAKARAAVHAAPRAPRFAPIRLRSPY